MGMPAVVERRWTAAEVRALVAEHGERYECVDGELLVSPPPRLHHRLHHQSAQSEIHGALFNYLTATTIGVVLAAPVDMKQGVHTSLQPDLLVLPSIDGRPPRTEEELQHALLFVEILSPSTAHVDRVVKRIQYQSDGVEYWIVDLDARLVERWLPESDRPEVCTDSLEWHPAGAAEPLRLDLVSIFTRVLGAP
ncbi:MAG: Uma2 family endonuclease [Gemmatimonadaceae bacterium]|jgi:Uma2 family endonuclease|nr:Uma2 family endonuclease [Gemmatimonadaceae bacterium]